MTEQEQAAPSEWEERKVLRRPTQPYLHGDDRHLYFHHGQEDLYEKRENVDNRRKNHLLKEE